MEVVAVANLAAEADAREDPSKRPDPSEKAAGTVIQLSQLLSALASTVSREDGVASCSDPDAK